MNDQDQPSLPCELRRIRMACFCIGVVAVLTIGCVVFAVVAFRRAVSQSRSLNMWAIAGSLASYEDVYQRLPPAVVTDESGRSLASWRFAILPFSPAGPTGPEDTRASYADLDHSWDDPVNRETAGRPLDLYCFRSEKTGTGLDTNVIAITGSGTAFDSETPHRMRELPNDTILLIEVSETGVPWAAPGDLEVRNTEQPVTLGTSVRDFLVVFADRSVWRLKKETPIATLRQFFMIEGARKHDREEELGPYAIERRSGV